MAAHIERTAKVMRKTFRSLKLNRTCRILTSRQCQTSTSGREKDTQKGEPIVFNQSDDLFKRGLVDRVIPAWINKDDIQQKLSSPVAVYCGFDPTAPSLHVGHLLSLMALLHGQRAGHTPIAVIGGATAMIGDPSGKNKDRPVMNAEDIENNIIKLTENVNRIFENHETNFNKTKRKLTPHKVLNNYDWYKRQDALTFLSETCRPFRVGKMLETKFIKERINTDYEGLNLTEFLYQILQATDWLKLFREHNTRVQIGGSDQTGNIKSGHDLIRRVTNNKELIFGLTVPLLLDGKGKKMGKSTGNVLWLDPDLHSPYDFYQYFFNLRDTDVERFLRLLTFLSADEIDNVMARQNQALHERHGQRTLAEQITLLVHGKPGLDMALQSTEVLFGSDPISHLKAMSAADLRQLFGVTSVREVTFTPAMTLLQLVVAARAVVWPANKKKWNPGEREDFARKIIVDRGVSVNQSVVSDPQLTIGEFILPNKSTLLRVGKKNYFVIKWNI